MKMVIFDLDDVLYHYDFEWRLEKFAIAANKSNNEIKDIWLDSGWEERAEAGALRDGHEYLREFNKLIGSNISRNEWVNFRKAALKPNLEALQVAKSLKDGGYKIAILTNNGALLGEEIGEIAPEASRIFGPNIHCSAQFMARKPNPETFSRLCDYYSVEPKNVIFIDDNHENVLGARSIGINSIRYTRQVNLKGEIDRLMAIKILRDPLDGPEIQQLLNTHLETMFSTSPRESCHAFDINELRHDSIKVWSLHYENNLAGCGALKQIDEKNGEVKSMHVYEKYRGKGFSKMLLETILSEAKNTGIEKLYLETGSHAAFIPAHQLYLSYGFIKRGPFGNYALDPHSMFFEKIL